jgi:hypothetical protein
MNLEGFIASKARRAELESETMPDLPSMTLAKLQKTAKERMINIRGPKQANVQALERQLHTMRSDYSKFSFQVAYGALRARPTAMFQSKVQHDPSRPSFLDLPGEIRNMIYAFASFESPQGDYAEAGNWALSTTKTLDGRFPPVRSQAYKAKSALGELRQDRTLAVLKTLGAMNKQIRQEVQTFFWANIKVTLDMDEFEAYCVTVQMFFDKIGADGRGALAGLSVPPKQCFYSWRQHHVSLDVLRLLRECKNLQFLNLCLTIDIIVGTEDRNALEDFFSLDLLFDSPSINDLV